MKKIESEKENVSVGRCNKSSVSGIKRGRERERERERECIGMSSIVEMTQTVSSFT